MTVNSVFRRCLVLRHVLLGKGRHLLQLLQLS